MERIGTAATSQFALMPSPNPSGNFTKINQRVPVRIKVDQPDDNPLRPGMIQQLKSMGEKVSKAYSTDLENLF